MCYSHKRNNKRKQLEQCTGLARKTVTYVSLSLIYGLSDLMAMA